MTEPQQPRSEKNAKSGVKPGQTPNTTGSKNANRPVPEEDVFGGADRVRKGKDVRSPKAKP
ncbi:hypothetical protein [Candidatus Viadribacter manganicus]|uniref:Uncharacterized protein n=1 Tax=Candidatus Viadribacter manganicus TaxID=1759059 RepID=A0A1B1AKJ8_9PROT|nr:hypothetical protein [Candidatus Viadribacter manganicus]ANP47084.1 hypothetical protein ATE48_14755 [Candidatus Viadribacter manganicus]